MKNVRLKKHFNAENRGIFRVILTRGRKTYKTQNKYNSYTILIKNDMNYIIGYYSVSEPKKLKSNWKNVLF